jgi:hypothetical protein
MWEARVKGRAFGRQRLQVCTIQDDQRIEWQDLDLPLLQKILHDFNGQELQIELLKERIGELKASSAALLMPVAVPTPKRRPRNEISPFGRRLTEARVAASEIAEGEAVVAQGAAVTALSNLRQEPCEPGCLHVGPNIGPPGGYARMTYTCTPPPSFPPAETDLTYVEEDGILYAGLKSHNPEAVPRTFGTVVPGSILKEPDQDFRTVKDCVSRFEGAILPPFGGFPFTQAMM